MTALDAAISRTAVAGVNAFGNYRWAQRLVSELNTTGRGEFVTEYQSARGAVNFGSQCAMVAVVLKREAH